MGNFNLTDSLGLVDISFHEKDISVRTILGDVFHIFLVLIEV